MNEGAKLAKLGANLIIGRKRGADGGRAKGEKGIQGKKERLRGPSLETMCASKRGRKREREKALVIEVERNPSIYMTAVCLGRLLMGRKRVVVIKGTRDSIQWHTERPTRMRLRERRVASHRGCRHVTYVFSPPPRRQFSSVVSPLPHVYCICPFR